MDVKGNVVFDGNTAVFGAGVAMSGRSLVSFSLTYRYVVLILSTLYRYCSTMVHTLSSLTMLSASWVQGSTLSMPRLTFSFLFLTLAASSATTLL